MSEAEILALTYLDLATVKRLVKNVDEFGETKFNDCKVYENIPCALSFSSGGKLNQTKSVAEVTSEYNIFTRPEINIEPNDEVIVQTLQGVSIEFIAGMGVRYISHCNIPLKLKKEVV